MAQSDFIHTNEDGTKVITTTKSIIAESVFRLKGKPFSLRDYPMMRAIYDCTDKFIVICSGRQIGKSTSAANFQVSECLGEPHWESLAVLPSIMQMRRYSSLRVGKVISDSQLIKKWFTNSKTRNNVTERGFLNGSMMYFGALSQVESLRGLSANRILEDEVQDMISDDLPIVEEALSGQTSDRQRIMRTGTAKTVGNLLESTLRMSTSNEWIIRCPAGHANIPSVDNIGPTGFICKKCKGVLDVRDGYWMAMNGLELTKNKPWVGFRIPQIIMPMHTEDPEKWEKILWKMHNLDPITFLNEVMGMAAGSGITILTEDHVKECCSPDYTNAEEWTPQSVDGLGAIMATVDWGLTARKSFTVLSIWGLTSMQRVKLIHTKRFVEPDIFIQIDQIARQIINFGVQAVGVDWGAGVVQSTILEQKIGRPVQRFMYVGEQNEMIRQDPNQRCLWKVNRTQAMMETFVKVRNKEYWFPNWKFFQDYAKDLLTIFEEPLDDRNQNGKIRYDHPEDSPDDWAHTLVYSNLLLHLMRGRGM